MSANKVKINCKSEEKLFWAIDGEKQMVMSADGLGLILHRPGLNEQDGTISFQIDGMDNVYVVMKETKLFAEPLQNSDDFKCRASFFVRPGIRQWKSFQAIKGPKYICEKNQKLNMLEPSVQDGTHLGASFSEIPI